MLLTLLVFIKIPLSVFPWVFLWRSGVEVFWGFGAKIKPAFCDVWSVGVLSVELSDWVLVEIDCSFLDGEVVIFGIGRPYGPGFGWMSPESAISLLRYRCVTMSDLNLILGGNLIRGFKVRA